MERKSFLFYLNWWHEIMPLMTDEEKLRFIENLVNFYEGNEINLTNKSEKMLWQAIKPGLEMNVERYEKRAEINRKNGALGGRPKKTEKNPNNPNNPNGFFGFSTPSGEGSGLSNLETEKNPNNPKNPIRDKRQEIRDSRTTDPLDGVGSSDTGPDIGPIQEEDIGSNIIVEDTGPIKEKEPTYFSEVRKYPGGLPTSDNELDLKKIPTFLAMGIMVNGQTYYPLGIPLISGPRSNAEHQKQQKIGKQLLKVLEKERMNIQNLYQKNKLNIINTDFLSKNKHEMFTLDMKELKNYLVRINLNNNQKTIIRPYVRAIEKCMNELPYYNQAIYDVKLAYTI